MVVGLPHTPAVGVCKPPEGAVFKHGRIKGYNSVNLRSGYQLLEIRSPKDLINYGD